MRTNPLFQHLKPFIGMFFLYLLSITLRSQSGEGSMTQFYIVAIVFAVIILGALLSFLFSQNKKRKD